MKKRIIFKRIISLFLCLAMTVNLFANIPIKASEELDIINKIEGTNDSKNIALHKEALEYALYTGDLSSNLEISSSKVSIKGDIHSNSNFEFRGSEIDIDGRCEAYGNIIIPNDVHYENILEKYENTNIVPMVDYGPQILEHIRELGADEYYGIININDRYVDISNGLIANDSLGIFSSQFTGNGVIYANNNITYFVSTMSSADNGKVVLCSANGNINIYASNTTINGIIYAPNGKVTISGSNVTINGRIIANEFNFMGSNLTIHSAEEDLDILEFLFLPSVEVKAEGEFKENRKITLDISHLDQIEKAIKENTLWDFSYIHDGIKEPAIEGIHYAIDDTTSDEFTKNMIFKKFGQYEVGITIQSASAERTNKITFDIMEDIAPSADFTIDDTYYMRDADNDSKAKIILKDFSYSMDNDAIGKRIWTVYHDSNNNNEFEEDEAEIISDGNETELIYKINKVGNFKVELTVIEHFENTIPSLISEEDYRKENTDRKEVTSKQFTIGNVKPESNLDVGIAKDIDIVLTVGSADVKTINLYADKVVEIKKELEDQGYTVKLSTVSTTSLTAQDTFAWTEYDHYNYADRYAPILPKHILYEGSNIKMLGYGAAPLKDFLLVEDENPSQKIFEFDIQRDTTDWHSMEGGGFLFNTSVVNGTIKGFYVLITQGGLKLMQIKGLPVTNFQNGSATSLTQLRTLSLSNIYAKHHFKIIVEKDNITLWDDDQLVIDHYQLPENDYGYGYGPITSHASHSCRQQSYFTFNNIIMQTITGENLSDVLASYEWSSNTGRYVINLSDSVLEEFETEEEIAEVAKQILEKQINFIGIGNSENNEQYTEIINSASGNGIYLDATNSQLSQEVLSNYMISSENEKDFKVDYYVPIDQSIRYIDAYRDYEKDPVYEEVWEYEYDPSVFGNKDKNQVENLILKAPITKFSDTGAYSIRLKVRDNPVGENDFLDEYRLWSDESLYQKVLMIHNRPISEMDVTVSIDKNDASKCIINVEDHCYDPDYENVKGKGIVSKEYKWKKLHDPKWTEGLIPSKVEIGEIYLISLTSKDKEGEVSAPCIKIIDTKDYIIREEETDDEPPVIHLELEKTKANTGESVKITGYATDNMGVDVFEIYINDELVLDHSGRVFYTGSKSEIVKITARAIDIFGNETTENRELVIVDNSDKNPPIVKITSPQNGAIMDFSVQINGSVYDDIKLKNYRLEYKKENAENYNLISEGETEVRDAVLGEWNVQGLESGTYEVRLSAEDGAGNTSYIIYKYELKASEESGIIDENIFDRTAPIIVIDLSTSKANVGEEVKANIIVTDDSKVESIKVYLDDVLVMESEGEITFSKAEPSVRKIKVYAADDSGNISIKEVSCIFVDESDKIPPTAIISTPKHEQKIKGSMSIIGTASDDTQMLRYQLSYKTHNTEEQILITEGFNPIEESVLGTWNTLGLENGLYDLRLTVEDQSGNMSWIQHTVIIENEKQTGEPDDEGNGPNLRLTLSKNIAGIGEKVKVYVSSTDNERIESIQVTVDGNDIVIVNGQGEFTSDIARDIIVKAVATDMDGNSTVKTAECSFYNFGDQTPPIIEVTSPNNEVKLNKPTEIIGSVYDETELAYYQVEYKADGASNYIVLEKQEVEKHNEVLAVLDTTTLSNGIYDVRITAVDKGGNRISKTYKYSIEGEFKIGNLNLGFEDVNAKISNVPVHIMRYYNSNHKISGDFGTGWSLGLGSMVIHPMAPLSEGWYMGTSGFGLSTVYYLEESYSHDVVINFGDGTTERFKAVISPKNQRLVPIYSSKIDFKSADSKSKNKLEIYGSNSFNIFGHLGEQILFDNNGNAFEPVKYKLTLEDETVIIINQKNGVESITDKSGNVIKVSQDGYKDGNGKGITFIRDIKGRISEIVENDGNTMKYTYDNQDNLIKVTDPVGNSVSFTYDDDHNIISMMDARGIEVARNEYDHKGRLIAIIDSEGKRTEFEHNIEGRTQVLTDKLGRKTVYIYDEDGKILSTTDANGNTTNNSYDADGNLSESIDALGNVTKYEINALGQIESLTNAMGNKVENKYNEKKQLESVVAMDITQMIVSYDDDGLLSKTQDAMGNDTNYEYDSKYRLTSISDSIGSYQSFIYDAKGNVISTTNGAGETASFTYDEKGRCISKTVVKTTEKGIENLVETYEYDKLGKLVKVINADGSVTNVEYDAIGQMVGATDAKGRRTSYDYDAFGNMVKITYADNTTETFEYDAMGRNIKATDRVGRVITMTYDHVGNLLTKTYPNGAKESYTYDGKYRVISVTGVNGGTTSYEYDAIDRNTAIIDTLGNRTEFTYNKESLLESMKDPKGNIFTFEYDLNGNRTKVKMPDGSSISTTYDARGRITEQTDQNDYGTTYTYDGVDRLISLTDAKGGKWEYSYNEVGELVTVTDANGNKNSYVYDQMGRIIKQTNVAGKSSHITYDKVGNVITSTDYKGITTTYTYDELDRLISKKTGEETINYTYTADGLLTKVSDANGTINYSYDMTGSLEKIERADGAYISYEYDTAYRLSKVKTAYGETAYDYDLMDRLVRVVAHNGTATLYEYDANGNRTAVKHEGGIITKYDYDELNRLIKEEILDKDKNIIAKYVYTLGLSGERLKVEETSIADSNRTVEYTYDELYRLTAEKIVQNNEATNITYTYDKVGNRLTKKENQNTTNYSYNNLNQLISETGITYSYDDNGNLIKKSEGNQTSVYTFNHYNRLIRATIQSGQNVLVEEYEYDYAGNRTAKKTENETIKYIVDINGFLSQVLYEVDGQDNLVTYYTRGAELISLHRINQTRYYLYDGHGSVRILVDEIGKVTDTYTYDAFGNLLSSTGETRNDYRYVGEQYDVNTGFYYLRARYMNPSTGTFISMDSHAGSVFDPMSLHKYLYAHANPVMNSDPTGYFTLADISISQSIRNTLDKIPAINYVALFKKLNLIATAYDMGAQVLNMISDPNMSGFDIVWALGRGVMTSIFLNQMCKIKGLGPVVTAFLAGFGLVSQFDSIIEAAEEGRWDLVAARTIQLIADIVALSQSCFTGDTLVETENGSKRIDEIEVGDKVWAYNTETNELELKEVTKVYIKESKEILHLNLSTGNIDTTTNHPFYEVEKGWVAAGDLEVGDQIYTLDGKVSIVVGLDLEKFDEPVRVYNLEVEDFHTYFVSGVLVHNYESSADENSGTKPYADSRPSYEKGQVDQVWENAKDPITGKVYDPSGVEIKWDSSKPRNGQWDMGHIPGEKYSDTHKLYMDGVISKEEFLSWYRNPNNYRPELPSTNRGHRYE